MSSPARRARPALLAVGAALAATVLTGCSWFGGGGSSDTVSTSVFDITPGQCFMAPAEIKAELSSIDRVPCTKPHTEESYATVAYVPPTNGAPVGPSGATSDSASAGAYPGADALTTFAKGACAERFGRYVGVSYLDSSLFFTYLLPSARSWEQDHDYNIICFVTQAGGTRDTSAKDSGQ